MSGNSQRTLSNRGLSLLVATGLFVVCLATLALAQSPMKSDEADLPPPLPPIRKIFVPERDLDSEARNLLPMRRSEFDRRWSTLQSSVNSTATPPAAVLKSATYRATLRGDSLAAGTADLQISRSSPVGSGSTPAWLNLSPCNLALGVPTWKASDSTAPPESVLWGQAGDGRLLVGLPQSGSQATGALQIPWSLRGKKNERGELLFDFQLPPATRQQLELILPANWMLRGEGVLIQPPVSASEEAVDQVWLVELPSHGRAKLYAEVAKSAVQLPPLVLVRETSSYVVSPGQVDVDFSFELDIDRTPLRELRVQYDSRLRWSNIRWGEQALPWTVESDDANEAIAVIALPEPLIGNSRLIQLTAVVDWSPSSQRWTLPRATVQGAIWQEGRANVALPRWLQLDAFAGSGAKLTATSLASGSQTADLLQFQLESVKGAIDLQQASGAPALDALSLTTLQVEPKQVIAQVVTEVGASFGNPFSVECEIPRPWLLESIDTIPADALEDRVVRSRGNAQLVTLQLKQPLRPGKPLRFSARLRHIRSAGEESWSDNILQPLRVPGATTAARYVTLQLADASFEPRLLNANGLEFLAPASLPAAVRGMSEGPLGNWVVRLADVARQPRFVLAAGSPRYVAESVLAINLGPRRAECKLRIHCQPDSSAVSRLLVQFRPAPPQAPLWRLVGDARPLVAERQESPAAGDETDVALFRLELPRSRDVDFTIEANWLEPVEGPAQISLPDLPEAAAHTSVVEINGPVDADTRWQAERLRPLPIPETSEPIRARYRFQAGQEARLKLFPNPESQRTQAGWISRCEVTTEFSPNGAARNEARYTIAGGDVESFEVRLAEHVRLARAVVNGRDVLAYSRPSDPRWLTVPLRGADGKSLAAPLVRLEYTTAPAVQTGWFGTSWATPLPETRLPILQSYWLARLPNGWRPWSLDGLRSARTTTEVSLWDLFQPASAGGQLIRDLPPGTEIKVEVYSAAWLGLLALATGMIAGAAALWVSRNSVIRLVSVTLALMAVSLLVFLPWRLFAEAAVAGWTAGLFCLLVGGAIKIPERTTSASSTNFVLQAARLLGIAFLLGTLIVANWLAIASPPAALGAEGTVNGGNSWRVVIPLGEDSQLTEFVYLSPGLYDALHRAGQLTGAQPDWLIRSAQYELRRQTAMPERPAELRGLLAQFEVDVLRERSQLRLPFLREQVRLTDPGVRIDGQPAAANWTDAGDALLLDLPQVGLRRVEIGLALAAAPKAGAQIRIPSIPSSWLQAPALASGEQLTLPEARGAESPLAGVGVQFALGAVPTLTVQLSHKPEGPAAVIEADQLLLWRLRPNSVVVDGKWQFRPLTGRLREVVVRADPRYRLLPSLNGGSFARQWTEEGEVNLHHFVLEEATTSDVSLSTSFLLVGSTGVGNLNPPRLEAVADRVRSDAQAVALAAGLQWTGKPGTLTNAEFLQAWGDAAVAPVQAWRMTPEMPRPTLTVAATSPRMQVEEQIEWLCLPDQVSGRFRFTGSQTSQALSQLRFTLPAPWNVRRIELTQGSEAIPLRWVRHADGVLSIAVDQVRPGAWTLELSVERSHVTGRPTSLPILVTSELDVARFECVIRERAGALATLGRTAGWQPIAEAAGVSDFAADRLLTRLEWSPSRPGATPQAIPVTIVPAWSRASGQLLTRLRSGDAGWRVELVAQLNAPGETIDELQFSVPRDWPDAVDLEPAGDCHVEPLPGQSRNLLRVRLAQPVKDQLTLRMSTSVMEELELVHLPAIDLIGPHDLQRWVALPRTDRGSRLQWQLAGLQARSDLPPAIATETLADETVYEAIIDRYRAIARPERARQESPRVVLADHKVAWQSDRRIVGRSEFTLLPGGARSILIQPPAAHELIAALVSDVPASLRFEPGISGAASIELHSDSWPQWVQVIYRGRMPVAADPGGDWIFSAPRIAGAPVDRTRWLVAGPDRLTSGDDSAARGSNVDDLLAPLETLAKVARGAGEVPGGNLAESTDTWLRQWRRYWDRELTVLQQQGSVDLREPSVAARLASLQAELADVLATPVVEVPESIAREARNELSPFTEISAAQPLFELRTLKPGDASTWKVQLAVEPESPARRWHWLAAIGLATCAVALNPAGRSGVFRDWLVRYPQLMLALTGCGVLVVPGYLWLGAMILGMALLVTLHSPWRQRA